MWRVSRSDRLHCHNLLRDGALLMSTFNPKRPAKKEVCRWKRAPRTSHSQHYDLILGGGVIKYKDGREVCQNNAAGRREYARRVEAMCQRQNWICGCSPDCSKRVTPSNATFGHANLRGLGGSTRDDRIVDENGNWLNAAETWDCNGAKGSTRTVQL